jgi:quercetin dioxygenase-like cupin family protein
VWVGLEHTTRESSLLLIPYSHKFGVTIQEMRHQLGKRREDCTTENVLEWASARDGRCRLDQPAMTDGWALFFDGRLWHGSHNRSARTRRAVLLQYASPDTPIRMPDPNQLDWPFRYLSQPRPQCLMLRGRSEAPVNRIVPGPVVAEGHRPVQLTGCVHSLQLPLSAEGADGWKPYPMLRGSTANLRHLGCHVSALATGRTPHPPHTHEEEELLLLLSGAADLILPDQPSADGGHRWRLEPGQFVYYPAHFPHTLEAVSEEPANYLMFKWHADATGTPSTLRFGRYDVADATAEDGGQKGFVPRMVFQGPTNWLRKLRCHVSTLTPGAGYEPHIDAHDVALVVFDGEIETLGQRVRPHGVVFCPAGELHGMRNPGNVTARYLVFEFHGSQAGLARTIRPHPTLLTKLLDPDRWKRKLRQLLSRPASQ